MAGAPEFHYYKQFIDHEFKCKCSTFPSSCNIRLQEREPCHPIKLQKDLNSALWLAHTVELLQPEVARTWKSAVLQAKAALLTLGAAPNCVSVWFQQWLCQCVVSAVDSSSARLWWAFGPFVVFALAQHTAVLSSAHLQALFPHFICMHASPA